MNDPSIVFNMKKKKEWRKKKGSGVLDERGMKKKKKLTAVESRDSDRKRNTPMIIGPRFRFLFSRKLKRPSHPETRTTKTLFSTEQMSTVTHTHTHTPSAIRRVPGWPTQHTLRLLSFDFKHTPTQTTSFKYKIMCVSKCIRDTGLPSWQTHNTPTRDTH